MAPLEDLQSRDLAWISDFVMQQVMIMLRPMMDHLQHTDAAVDYAQRSVQRLSMDLSETRGDIERTNKYLAILRQGLGVQNEGKCVLQRSVESTGRTVKRLDDQMESMLAVMRGVEDSVGQLCADMRGAGNRQDDLAKQVAQSSMVLQDLQEKIGRVISDTHSIKDDVLSNEAKMEVWQRELRELRRSQFSIGSKLDEKPVRQEGINGGPDASVWPPKKKPFATPAMEVSTGFPSAGEKAGSGFYGAAATGLGGEDSTSSHSGSGSQQSKRVSRVGSGSGRGGNLLQQAQFLTGTDTPDGDDGGLSIGAMSAMGTGMGAAGMGSGGGGSDETSCTNTSRLPLLAAKQSGNTRPLDTRGSETSGVPRLRFAATMSTKPSSRGGT